MASAGRPVTTFPLAAPAEAAHSGIRAMAARAAAIPGAIRLDVGQPDFPTPPAIAEAGRRAIADGATGYTPTAGEADLVAAIQEKLVRVNGYAVPPESITCAAGGVGAIAAAFAAILEPGDEVLLPDPGWPNYTMMLPWTHARGVRYPCPADDGFLPDPDRVAALIGPRTRLLVVNSPNNPTGVVYPRSLLTALGELAARRGIWLLSDECYDEIIFRGRPQSPAAWLGTERVVSVYTFSKTYAMTGWRLGYATGPARLVDTMVKVLESNSSCTSSIAQRAARAALLGAQDVVAEMVAAYRRRRDLAVRLLTDAGLCLAVPEGAFYIMAGVGPWGDDSPGFADALLRELEVSVVPGTAFGAVAPAAVRVSLASSDQDLEEGLRRLVAFARGAA